MRIKKEKLLPLLGYTLFAVGAFLFFLYWTFPIESLERLAFKRVEADSGCRIKIAQRHLTLPLGLSGSGIAASCPRKILGVANGTGRVDLKIAALDLRLAPLPLLLKKEVQVAFRAALGGGTLSGDLVMMRSEEGIVIGIQSIEGKQVDLAELGLGAAGRLSLKGDGTWLEKDVLKGSGQLHLTVENGRLSEIGGWTLPLGELSFSKAEAQLSWKDGRIDFDPFSLQGQMADLQGERGNLLLRRPFDASLLTLSFQATPKGTIKEMAMLFVQGYNGRDPLNIRINGALRNIQLSVNGRSVPLGA